jgi:hypothetical protein
VRPDALGVVTIAAMAFFAPAAVLAAVGPVVVKLQLRSLGETGSVVGRLSALGTAGAILGTFATGFVLVSALPTRPIIVAAGIALVVAGVAVSIAIGRSSGPVVTTLAIVAAVLALGWTATVPQRCERESAYFCINVRQDPGNDSGVELRMDSLRHAYVDLDDPTWLEFAYVRLIGDVVDAMASTGEPIDALHLVSGAAGSRSLATSRPCGRAPRRGSSSSTRPFWRPRARSWAS